MLCGNKFQICSFGGKNASAVLKCTPPLRGTWHFLGAHSEAGSVPQGGWGGRGHWKRPHISYRTNSMKTHSPADPGVGFVCVCVGGCGPERSCHAEQALGLLPMHRGGFGGACPRLPADAQAKDLKGEGTAVPGPVITSFKEERNSTCSQDALIRSPGGDAFPRPQEGPSAAVVTPGCEGTSPSSGWSRGSRSAQPPSFPFPTWQRKGLNWVPGHRHQDPPPRPCLPRHLRAQLCKCLGKAAKGGARHKWAESTRDQPRMAFPGLRVCASPPMPARAAALQPGARF